MGVKDFTKVFEPSCEFHYKDFKNKRVVIDASVEIYRAALGMKKLDTLTDAYGKPTGFINVILLNILKLKANGADQYWIFDYNNSENKDHNPLKQLELQKRKEKRDDAKNKIAELKDKLDSLDIKKSELFTDDEDEVDVTDKIDKQEKIAFSPGSFYFEDIKFILDMLDIPYLECPPGFDAEQLAAIATNISIFDKKMDCVLTPDADCLVFGAKQLIKRDIIKKKLFKYNLQEILDKYEISREDLIKISVILGTDFAPKTPRIGPKTVLKKYEAVELSDDQKKAYDKFMTTLTPEEIISIKNSIKNNNTSAFSNKEKYITLLDWLVSVKNFNKIRIEKHFDKLKLFQI